MACTATGDHTVNQVSHHPERPGEKGMFTFVLRRRQASVGQLGWNVPRINRTLVAAKIGLAWDGKDNALIQL